MPNVPDNEMSTMVLGHLADGHLNVGHLNEWMFNLNVLHVFLFIYCITL